MIKFDNIYDFYYKLTQEERENLLGEILTEKDRLYFPVWLNNKWENYGHDIGLLILLKPFKLPNKKIKFASFKVGAFSPDDLDIDIWFEETTSYQEVLDYVKSMNKIGVDYKELIFSIKEKFPDGKLYI